MLQREIPSISAEREQVHGHLRSLGVPCAFHPDAKPDKDTALLPEYPGAMAHFYAPLSTSKFKLQRLITKSIEDRVHAAHFADSDQRTRALLLSTTGYSAGAWLCAIPRRPSLQLTDTHFAVACLLRIGARFNSGRFCNSSGCRALLRPATCVDHFFSCNKSVPVHCTVRHHLLSHLTFTQCERSGVPSLLENQPDPVIKLRPDGTHFFPHKTTLSDTTVRHPTASTYIQSAAKTPGSTLKKAVRSKNTHYSDLADSEGASFTALALETFGRMHADYRKFLRALAQTAADTQIITPSDIPTYVTTLVQEVSVCLQRGNALAILRGLSRSRQ